MFQPNDGDAVERVRAQSQSIRVVIAVTALILVIGVVQHGFSKASSTFARLEATTAQTTESSPTQSTNTPPVAAITVDYPEDGSIFPPEITPPTFLWRDASDSASFWTIKVTFSDGSPEMQTKSPGERLRIGELDPRCISPSNEPPKLTPEQAAARTWIPDTATWEAIKKHSKEHPATITITGFESERADRAISSGEVVIQTSQDPVGAPIFYRDVPLIPSELQEGVIKPLAQGDLPLLSWRLRNIAEPRSRLLLTGLHTCANCHSFSRDGKTLGMDLDAPPTTKVCTCSLRSSPKCPYAIKT